MERVPFSGGNGLQASLFWWLWGKCWLAPALLFILGKCTACPLAAPFCFSF